jgi:hypothetical protein
MAVHLGNESAARRQQRLEPDLEPDLERDTDREADAAATERAEPRTNTPPAPPAALSRLLPPSPRDPNAQRARWGRDPEADSRRPPRRNADDPIASRPATPATPAAPAAPAVPRRTTGERPAGYAGERPVDAEWLAQRESALKAVRTDYEAARAKAKAGNGIGPGWVDASGIGNEGNPLRDRPAAAVDNTVFVADPRAQPQIVGYEDGALRAPIYGSPQGRTLAFSDEAFARALSGASRRTAASAGQALRQRRRHAVGQAARAVDPGHARPCAQRRPAAAGPRDGRRAHARHARPVPGRPADRCAHRRLRRHRRGAAWRHRARAGAPVRRRALCAPQPPWQRHGRRAQPVQHGAGAGSEPRQRRRLERTHADRDRGGRQRKRASDHHATGHHAHVRPGRLHGLVHPTRRPGQQGLRQLLRPEPHHAGQQRLGGRVRHQRPAGGPHHLRQPGLGPRPRWRRDVAHGAAPDQHQRHAAAERQERGGLRPGSRLGHHAGQHP